MIVELRRVLFNPALVIGLLAVSALLFIGVFGTLVAPSDPNAQHSLFVVDLPNGQIGFRFPPTTPDAAHPLGTDPLGRDQWSRILAGARLTLTAVLGAALVRLTLGLALGLTSGWTGGMFDRVVRTLGAGFSAIPQLPTAILLVLVTRTFGVAGFIGSLALVGWPEIVELLRAEVIRVKAAPFMESARALGSPTTWIVRRHLVTALAPRLLTVAALETGSVLLLLAELGLIGLFLAGSTFYVADNGQPILPIRDRAPEWGQMLGGVQFYAIQDQLVVLIPALFVVLAAVSFGLLADGLRAASDPHGSVRLRPGTFGALAKVLAIVLVASAFGFVGANARPNVLTMDEGRALAARTAELTWPGSTFVAGVVRFSTESHAMERPDRLTFYYRRSDRNEVLRITFKDADRDAVEVRPFETEDEIDFTKLKALPSGVVSYDKPITQAEASGGASYRTLTPNYLVRAIVSWPADRDEPVYEVTYGTTNRGQLVVRRICCFDAKTGEAVDSLVIPRIPPPYPVPAACAATRLVVQQRDVFPAYFATGPALAAGSFLNLYFAGDNSVQYYGAPGELRLVEAANLTRSAPPAVLVNVTAASGQPPHGFATLRLPSSGCWRVALAVGVDTLEYVVWAYPYDCRPGQYQGPLPPGVVFERCTPP